MFKSVVDRWTKKLILEDRFTNTKPERPRVLDLTGGPKVEIYASDIEVNRRDFKYRINKEVEKGDTMHWSAVNQNLQYMNKTVWLQEFDFERDQMGESWSITQTLAFNMSDEAFFTLTVRDRNGEVQERDYTIYVAAE